MKYFYKIAIVFLLLLIVWPLFNNSSTTEYFSKKEQKAMQARQKFVNILKPLVIKGKISEKNISIKEGKIIKKKMHKIYDEIERYDKDLSPTQIKKMNNVIEKRYPWIKSIK